MMESTTVRLPPVITTRIYDGKYTDRNPDFRAAGKLTYQGGESTKQCMKPERRPPSPEVIRRFRNTFFPSHGEMRVHYGKAYDPHNRWAKEMTHGVCTQPSLTAGQLANPQPKTLFQQKMQDKKEGVYASRYKMPLGRVNDCNPGLPETIDKDQFAFGITIEKGDRAGEIVNPDKSYTQVERESDIAHEMYRYTHTDFYPAERFTRNYKEPHYGRYKQYGIPTPHDNAGKFTKQSMKWITEYQDEKATKIVNKRLDDFRERTQPQLGKVHDPIKDTLNVGLDHTFGIMLKPDEYGAGDLIHGRGPANYMRGKERQRGIVAALRQHLKKANYHNFQDLMHAFRFYDKEGTGLIDINQLRNVCIQFNLPAEPELLEQVFDYCDVNRDGYIDYVEFSNFLNWKDKMPTGVSAYTPLAVVKDEDIVPKSPSSRESTPRRLQKQIDKAAATYKTSASMINGVVGGLPTHDYRRYGIPTIRSDLSAPKIKRVSDHSNYGDESNAYGLTNPNLFSTHNVYEKDLLIPRPKEEIRQIFDTIGVKMTLDTFDELYKMASQRHPKSEVSVEAFRNILDELQAAQMIQ